MKYMTLLRQKSLRFFHQPFLRALHERVLCACVPHTPPSMGMCPCAHMPRCSIHAPEFPFHPHAYVLQCEMDEEREKIPVHLKGECGVDRKCFLLPVDLN